MYSHRKKYIHFHEQLQEIMSITLLEKLPATELGCGRGGGEKNGQTVEQVLRKYYSGYNRWPCPCGILDVGEF